MVSERKRAANRQNASRSTGPRTDEGKARSRRNATRHGLDAARVVLSPAEADGYRRRLDEWEADLRPADEVERELVARAVFATIILDRIAALLGDGDEEALGPARARNLIRHDRRWSRALERALDDLRRRRADPSGTNPNPDPPARGKEANERPDEPREQTRPGPARRTASAPSYFQRTTSAFSPRSWMVAAVLVLGLLATRSGHEPDARGHERAPSGHVEDTTRTREDAGGHGSVAPRMSPGDAGGRPGDGPGARPSANRAKGRATSGPIGRLAQALLLHRMGG